MHADEIRKDCTETVECLGQRGEPSIDNPVESCIQSTASLLDTDATKQDAFLANFGGCQQLVACEYLECALSDP